MPSVRPAHGLDPNGFNGLDFSVGWLSVGGNGLMQLMDRGGLDGDAERF